VDLDLRLETVHHFTCELSKILGAAQEWGYVPDNLARKTRLPRRQHRAECMVLTPCQVRDLAAVLDEPACSVVLLLVRTGLRAGDSLHCAGGTSMSRPACSACARPCMTATSSTQDTAQRADYPDWRGDGGDSRRASPCPS